ncbi:MAG: hypothetical protein RQ731_08415 [Anaerosomatales bacterium]|nr:hypothetical protein [Anaerosomatales bacterium]
MARELCADTLARTRTPVAEGTMKILVDAGENGDWIRRGSLDFQGTPREFADYMHASGVTPGHLVTLVVYRAHVDFFDAALAEYERLYGTSVASAAAPPARKAAIARQREWASSRSIALDSAGYTLQLDDNLYQPLSAATCAEFESADGSELGSKGGRGKMQALHSSSALGVNVFEHWRDTDTAPLASALGIDSKIVSVGFEHKYPTGLPGTPPNLDVVLELDTDGILAIESKYLEPYGSRHTSTFKPQYFTGDEGLWARHGMLRCQSFAERIAREDIRFRWLNAAQLLKHALGLAVSAGVPWSLAYIWYRVPGPEGDGHAAEVEQFVSLVSGDPFLLIEATYQDLIDRIARQAGPEHADYLRYIQDRYMSMSG